MSPLPFQNEFRLALEKELRGDILPFWIQHTVDDQNGGFYGALTNDLHILNDTPRSAVLTARILWTYAAAYRLFKDPAHLKMAQHAYTYLTGVLWDKTYGGVYWSVDRHGNPVSAGDLRGDRKHTYAQSFAIYGLSEFALATGNQECLGYAKRLFHLLEEHTHDPVNGGNLEGRSREWGKLPDERLGDGEPLCVKSMNTMLHLMEAYTNLLRAWDDDEVRQKQRGALLAFLDHIVDPQTYHFRCFFDAQWNSLIKEDSYGHDIEGSWLILEAAEVQGDEHLVERARQVAVKMADAILHEALEADGALVYELNHAGKQRFRSWWAHAEAVVGLWNAYQISGRAEFADASYRTWGYITDKFLDRTYGEWYKILSPEGVPDLSQVKAGPWECPYHNARMCYEMMARLNLRS